MQTILWDTVSTCYKPMWQSDRVDTKVGSRCQIESEVWERSVKVREASERTEWYLTGKIQSCLNEEQKLELRTFYTNYSGSVAKAKWEVAKVWDKNDEGNDKQKENLSS